MQFNNKIEKKIIAAEKDKMIETKWTKKLKSKLMKIKRKKMLA